MILLIYLVLLLLEYIWKLITNGLKARRLWHARTFFAVTGLEGLVFN